MALDVGQRTGGVDGATVGGGERGTVGWLEARRWPDSKLSVWRPRFAAVRGLAGWLLECSAACIRKPKV